MKLKTQEDFFNKPAVTEYYRKDYSNKDRNFKIINSLERNKKTLSLGCGGGREAKELIKRGHKVIAIDSAENMIIQSKKVEPKAKYYCVDAVKFAEENKDKLKFDYILGLFSFLCYIEPEKSKEFINNLVKMLNPKGMLIFEVRMVNERFKDIIKVLISPFYALFLKKRFNFGDVYSKSLKEGYTKSHHFTNSQLNRLFRDYKFEIINGNQIYIYK